MLLAAGQAEKLFCNSSGHDENDLLSARILACNVTSQPRVFLDCAEADAARIVIEQRSRIEAVAQALIECRILTSAEIAAVLSGRDLLARKRWGNVIESAALFRLNHGGLETRRL